MVTPDSGLEPWRWASSRTKEGAFRGQRGDSLVKNLKKEYPKLEQINGNTRLDTLPDKLGVDSLDGVLKELRKN